MRAFVMAEGVSAPNARAAVEPSYAAGKNDEFVEPTIVGAAHPMADGDQVICYNFRADRARELTAALTLPTSRALRGRASASATSA